MSFLRHRSVDVLSQTWERAHTYTRGFHFASTFHFPLVRKLHSFKTFYVRRSIRHCRRCESTTFCVSKIFSLGFVSNEFSHHFTIFVWCPMSFILFFRVAAIQSTNYSQVVRLLIACRTSSFQFNTCGVSIMFVISTHTIYWQFLNLFNFNLGNLLLSSFG